MPAPAASRRPDAEVLEEIQTRFAYAKAEWQDIQREGATDMRYVAGDPWPEKDKKERDDLGRPHLALDEIGQYVNQLINEIRQNKRAIEVTPLGSGATDQTAELRANLIRQIEYRSNAQQAYTTMFENAVQRSYGYLRIRPDFVNPEAFDQELLIEPLVNPDLVLIDPDAQKPDASDMRFAFIYESWAIKDFEQKWPKAKVIDFASERVQAASDWAKDNRVQVAEYWTVEHDTDELWLIQGPQGPQMVRKSSLPDNAPKPIKTRPVQIPRVTQYFTNGLEILSTTDWPGKHIPLVPCFGKVLYVATEDGPAKRQLMSLVRLMRNPVMLYNHTRTTQCEIVAMTPKVPFIGYTGQFRGHDTTWQKVSHQPMAYLEVEALTEATGNQILPLPQRQPYEPAIQALEVLAEAARRAIQSAGGGAALPTQAQRHNEKSGIALQKISDSTQKGNFHFIDHYEAAIVRTGVILEDLIPHYYDTTRDVTVRTPADKTSVQTINDPAKPETATNLGQHDVTLSTGPSMDSEREAASQFADMLVGNPQIAPILLPLAIKLKNLGPIGDEMVKLAEFAAPPPVQQFYQQQAQEQDGGPPAIPPQVQQQMSQMQQQLQQANQLLQHQHQLIEAEGQKYDAQMQIETMKADKTAALQIQLKTMDNAAKIEAARISAAKQSADLMAEQQEERLALMAGQAHDLGMQAHDQAHEATMAEMGQAHALASQQQAAALQPAPDAAPLGGA